MDVSIVDANYEVMYFRSREFQYDACLDLLSMFLLQGSQAQEVMRKNESQAFLHFPPLYS